MNTRSLPFLLLVGCIQFKVPESAEDQRERVQAERRAHVEAVNAQHQREEQEAVERIAKRAQEREAERVEVARSDAERKAEATNAAAEALVRSCAEDRDQRHTRLDAHLASYEERNKLLDWEEKHCKIVDRGKPVVREYEMPNGVIVKRRVISGYPERECDAKEPKGLPRYRIGTSYRYQGVMKLPESEHQKNQACLDLDLAAGWDHVDRDEEEAKK